MSDATTTDREASHHLLKWKRDIILASSPAQTGNADDLPLNLIVLAMLRLHKHLPRLEPGANIDKQGIVTSFMVTEKDKSILYGTVALRYAVLGKVQDINDALRRLADHCKLSDTDRKAMFKAFADWISHDARANDKHGERVH